MLKEAEVNKHGKNQYNAESHDGTRQLSDYGITKNESSTFQKISTIPEREPEVRSYNMSQIKEKDTKPEITIRKITS